MKGKKKTKQKKIELDLIVEAERGITEENKEQFKQLYIERKRCIKRHAELVEEIKDFMKDAHNEMISMTLEEFSMSKYPRYMKDNCSAYNLFEKAKCPDLRRC